MLAPQIYCHATKELVAAKWGEPVSISLQVLGTPEPEVKWFLGGHHLASSLDYWIKKRERVHSLYISRATDEVNYGLSVVAQNQAGEDKKDLNVKVYKSEYHHLQNV